MLVLGIDLELIQVEGIDMILEIDIGLNLGFGLDMNGYRLGHDIGLRVKHGLGLRAVYRYMLGHTYGLRVRHELGLRLRHRYGFGLRH